MNLKIAVVHDWLVTDGGAEKVLSAILEIYPHAEIFSLVDFLNDEDRYSILKNRHVTTSFLQNMPFAKKHFRNYLPLFPRAIESFDLSSYDLVISSSWAVAKGVKTNKNQLHISYCYTPIRYAWDLYDEYTQNLKQPKKMIVQKTLQYIKKWDIQTLDRVDYFIADSKFVQERIKKTYNREAVVIYPPVDVDNFKLQEQKEDFYLSASRLVPYKKTKLIVEAFNKMPNKRLVVIGDGEEYQSIKTIAKQNIEVLGYRDKKIMIEYMQRAKAFVYGAIEDFGIIVIEAQACGTPVIALNYGGTKETVKDKFNGLHFKSQELDEIIKSVNNFEKLEFNAKNISKSAQSYSIPRFKQEIKNFVNDKLGIK